MPIAADFDHVAVAAERFTDLWPRYARDLGGAWAGQGAGGGFLFAQLRFANEMRLEMLEPNAVEENDFLRRFLDRSGPGVHHVTFKVADFDAALDAASDAGFPPVNVNRDDPGWLEAFIHPKLAGIVVQIAHAGDDDEGFDEELSVPALPEPSRRPASLDALVHLVADIDMARSLFEGVLGGRALHERADVTGVHVELAWPGPGHLHLVQPSLGTAESTWLDSRPGRAHHLAFTAADPATIPDAVARRDGSYEIAPEANLGVRLIVSTPVVA